MTLQHSYKISCLVLLTTIIGCINNYSLEWYETEYYRWRPINVGWFGKTGFSAQPLETLGITFSNELTKELIANNRVLLNGSGVAVGDINGDGLSDLYFARLDGCGINDGSGVGNVPASLKPPPAEITDAGPPTGFCAVPERGPGCIPTPAVPIPGINPGECVPPAGAPAAILSSVFFISMITFTDKNSNAEYATT